MKKSQLSTQSLHAVSALTTEEIRYEHARRRLATFIPAVTPRYLPPHHLKPLTDRLELAAKGIPQFVVCHAPPRHAKAVDDETPMMTRRGWVRAGNVRLGDELVGSDGKWVEVLGVYPQGVVPLWRVKFSDGASLVTCADHRWQVSQRYGYAPTVRTTEYLRQSLAEGDGRCKWRIPVAAPMEGDEQPLPIEPYLLGLWLGDGSSSKAEITTMDSRIIDAFREAGYPTSYEAHDSQATTYGLRGGLYVKLKAAGLLRNKHVPECYLRSPPAVRLAVLQGIADTDGTVARNGSSQTICTTKPALAQAIKILVSSLGGVWRMSMSYPKVGKPAQLIAFRLPRGVPGFRLERKLQKLNTFGPRNAPRRLIRSIEPAGTGSATCFTVDAADHLFCAGHDFVVTHNTETLVHFPAYALRRNPRLTVGYATYGQSLTRSSSKKIRRVAESAGIRLASATIGEWRNSDGGGVLATTVGGPLTGYGINVMLIDDPYKNRIDAESAAYRSRVQDWFNDVVVTRIEPGGSIFLFMTRWHPDDLSGYLIREKGFEYVQLPAITVDGTGQEHSLWPERWPLAEMQGKREATHAYTWESLYQGNPRPRGQRVFGDANVFTTAPIVYRDAFGLDLSYTRKTTSDFSVAIHMRKQGRYFYVTGMVRQQVRAPEFKAVCFALHTAHPSAPWRWYAAGTETGTADFFVLGEDAVPLQVMPPLGDKFTRALSYAAAWNAGLVLVPQGEPWVEEFLAEHASFTGTGDKHDDIIDASVAAFDLLDDKGAGVIDTQPRQPRKPGGLAGMSL